MAQVDFSVMCTALYESSLEVPNEIAKDREKTLQYIREHLSEAPVADVEWLSDIEPENAVTAEDIKSITGLDEEEADIPVMRI